MPDWALDLIRLPGGSFVLYLAWGAYSRRDRQPAKGRFDDGAESRSLAKAALTNLLNPNPYLFWSLAIGPVFLTAWRQAAFLGLGFLLGFYGTLIGGFAGP